MVCDICADLISASLLYHMSHCCLPNQKKLPFGFLLAKTKFFSVSFGYIGLEEFGELADLFSPFSGRRKDRGDWVFFVFEMGTAAIAAMFMF